MEEKEIIKRHSLELKDNSDLKCTGVLNVDRYDEKEIVGKLEDMCVVISGENLSIKNFNANLKVLDITGKILCIKYLKAREKGFLKKIFK